MNHISGLLATTFFLIPFDSFSQDWPTFRRDSGRTGFVNAELDPARFEQKWIWKSQLPPEPAWDGPARWDAYAEIKDLPAMRQYDACFHPVSDGNTVYFGSSSQDTLYALDQTTGKQKWFFVAGGPIRIAPTLHEDSILFGSDDGNAYCLDKTSGNLVWKFNPSEHSKAEQRRVINNDRLISFYPVRTGIVVRDKIAYFAASFLPWRESYLCGIDVESGSLRESQPHFVSRHENATLEGPILIAEERLIVPQGRIAPLLFDRTNGSKLGNLPGGGGVTIVVTEKGNVARAEGGRAARPGQLGVFKGKERVASFPKGRSLVVRDQAFYVIDGEKIFAASRKANEILWQRDFEEPLEIIVVGQNVIVGG
ncbi:MAG: PQQ-binding-like beta-propeller repeat protein, partial [Planctomycetota bacterium]|nr:PQQ-binding-like beta-propeller repeat protein [Planctomycetota bacterium]